MDKIWFSNLTTSSNVFVNRKKYLLYFLKYCKLSNLIFIYNPFKVIYQGSKDFVEEGQEETFVRFTMNEDGDYTNVNYLPKNIVKRIEDMIGDPEIHFHPRNDDEKEEEEPWEWHI